MVTHPRMPTLKVAILVVATFGIVLLGWHLYSPPALYRVTLLPSIGGLNTHADSLNDHGQVVGLVYDIGSHTGPFLWDHTHGVQDLCPGGAYRGLRINNAGQIAGTMPIDPNNPKSETAFLWEPGKGRTMLGTLGGKRSIVHAMNNRGQIVGMSATADGVPQAFLWDKETGMKEVASPAGGRYIPESINDAGQILVEAIERTASLSYDHSWFLLDSNGPKRLAPLPPDTQLLSMNASYCIAAIEKPGHPTSYLLLRDEQGTWRRLFPINSAGPPTRLNDRNQIAYSESAYGRGERIRNRARARFFPRPFPSPETQSYPWA